MMSRTKGLSAGLLAGLVAAVAMTVTMLLLACVGIATPLVIIGDRLSFFISSERLLPDFIFSFGQDRKAKIENLVPRSDGARWFWVDLACSLREAAERCCANFIAQPPSVTTARNTKVESFSLLRLTSHFIA